ncbi:MAG: hypothetical protein NC089_11070 [Bacteroides sp.]|nr:hypothetical protein [Bacteroides sp.]MCM1550361.1 hypothetical protein [Clostridium sp.]
MWIAGTTEVRENQGVINVAKQKASSQESLVAKVLKNSNVGEDKEGSGETINGVALNISNAGKQKLEEQDNFLSFLQDQLDSIKEQEKAGEEGWEDFGRCLKIAASIAAGDNVPQKDMQFLQEHEPELFMKAMLLRRPKEDPEDCDSVLEDEEDSGDSGAGSAKVVESGSSVDMGSSEGSASADVSVE